MLCGSVNKSEGLERLAKTFTAVNKRRNETKRILLRINDTKDLGYV